MHPELKKNSYLYYPKFLVCIIFCPLRDSFPKIQFYIRYMVFYRLYKIYMYIYIYIYENIYICKYIYIFTYIHMYI